jgi:hypothetical protein
MIESYFGYFLIEIWKSGEESSDNKGSDNP